MAQIDIKNLQKIVKERNFVHDEVEATYTVFEDHGKKYLQIDTYGRKWNRLNPGKVSQSFQFDRIAAEHIVSLLIREFDLKLH